MRLLTTLAVIVLVACSRSNGGTPDDGGGDGGGCDSAEPDTSTPDAPIVDATEIDAPDAVDAAMIPPPPELGAQLDRAGRPLIGSALIGMLSDDATRDAMRDEYNRAADPAAWRTTLLRPSLTIEDELELSLAKFDAIDKGFMVSGQTQPLPGCENGFRYSQPVRPDSYQIAAALFADDQLYIDTGKQTCGTYLALEIELASGGFPPHAACGGRTPSHDVVDVTYSVIAAGLDGLEMANGFSGLIRDGVTAHADIKATFPFLGAPH